MRPHEPDTRPTLLPAVPFEPDAFAPGAGLEDDGTCNYVIWVS